MSKLLYGTDPECAAVYEKNGNLYALPPYFFRTKLGVPASSDPKHPVFLEGDGWKCHEDGAAFEFAVRPSHNPLELFQTVQNVRETVNLEILSKFPQYCLPELQFLPTVGFDVERWNSMMESGEIDPAEFAMSTRFGCDPDEDVCNLTARASVINVGEHPFRYCGGHLHVSGSAKIVSDPHQAVRCMILGPGLAAVAYSPVPELEHARTFYYGRPGKFRVQRYRNNPYGDDYAVGIEYRTPSATWAGNWDVAQPVLHWAEVAISVLLEQNLGEELFPEISERAIDAILSADQQTARELLSYVESKL